MMLENPCWTHFFNQQQEQSYFIETTEYIKQRRNQAIEVYPPEDEVFSAFDATPFNQIKVVILGQDPYHGFGQAHGLCFSVKDGIKPPPSLANIFKELSSDIEGFQPPFSGNLTAWAKQGVLLLNTVLTVEKGLAHSHKHLGWEHFTDEVIQYISDNSSGVVFLLWGAHAIKKGRAIDLKKHFILEAPHPSPLSAHRGFLGCQHFSKTNQLLVQQSKTPINWCLD